MNRLRAVSRKKNYCWVGAGFKLVLLDGNLGLTSDASTNYKNVFNAQLQETIYKDELQQKRPTVEREREREREY